LIPYGKAIPATAENLKKFEARRAEFEQAAQASLAGAVARSEGLKDITLTITARAMEEGKLFGSVGIREIIQAFQAKNIKVEKREIIMPMGTIHSVGEYEIEVMLHSDVRIKVKVMIEAEK
jgi:large subunit ribosomal protein L9